MKIKCIECDRLAVWDYMPGSEEIYFCEEHIHRGCSCQYDYETYEPLVDEQGRLLPCVEYDYSEFGFEEYDDDEHYRLLDLYNKE